MGKFSNVQIGDRVWSIKNKWGSIYMTSLYNKQHRIAVNFDNNTTETYDVNGKRYVDGVVELYWNEFYVPTQKEDKKPIDLINFLKENIEPKEFKEDEHNMYFKFSYFSSEWNIAESDMSENPGSLYFTIKTTSSKILSELTNCQITPRQLIEAYKILKWI